MYKHTLRVNGEYLAKEQELPANTSVVGNGGAMKAGSTLGSVEVVMTAAGAVSFPADSKLTVEFEGSDDGETFEIQRLKFIRIFDLNSRQFADGEEIARLPLPSDAKKLVRCRMATDASGVTGKVDVFCDFLPR